VALATAMGQQLARRLLGGASVQIDMPISSIKPFALHPLWPLAVKSAVLFGRMRDYLQIS
jgi:hypothetical protein